MKKRDVKKINFPKDCAIVKTNDRLRITTKEKPYIFLGEVSDGNFTTVLKGYELSMPISLLKDLCR